MFCPQLLGEHKNGPKSTNEVSVAALSFTALISVVVAVLSSNELTEH